MKNILILFVLSLLLWSCGRREFVKNPVDQLILEMDKVKNFTIILYDMDIEGTFSETYKHRYKIITHEDTSSIPKETITDWMVVDEEFFDLHSNDLGMEIASKKNGVVSKHVAPPGYSNYVGNSQYGTWRTNPDGTSFWEFYGQYAFLSNMIGLIAGPVYRHHYHDYHDYRSRGVPYYGSTPSGTPMYGTHSEVATRQNPNSKLASSNSFKSKIQSRVARSSGSSSTSGVRSSPSTTTRSTPRSGTSTRSRSSSRGGK